MGLHDGHRQRMRQQFLSHGPQSMADHELLELALFYAIPRRDTNETAHRLLEQFGSLDRVLTAPEQELEQVFRLTDRENRVYRCWYCESAAHDSGI